MKLSIIIPCYNVEHFLGDTIKSIINQTDSLEYEVIVVDDGSNDGTYQVAKDVLKPIKHYQIISKSNGGVSSARNEGLRHASGEYVYFLDGDDIIDSFFFKALNLNNASSDIIYWNYLHERNFNSVREVILHQSNDIVEAYLLGKLPICMCSLLFKRQLINDHHMFFDENTAYGEDREFIIKGLFYANTYNHINQFLFTYKWRAGSAMRVRNTYNKKNYSCIESCLRVYELFQNSGIRKYMDASLNNLCVPLLLDRGKLQNEKGNEYIVLIDRHIKEYLPMCKISFQTKFTAFVSVSKIFYLIHPCLLYSFLKALVRN